MTSGVTTHLDRDTVSATTIVDASPSEVFEFIRQPAHHGEISGDGTVQGVRVGPDRLGEGDRFGMRMKLFGLPYRVTSKVVEFEPDRLIAWCHIAGHRWRWLVEPADGGQTRVTETFDLSTARVPPALRLAGFPKRHEANVARSVANVAAHFAPS
jgi:uncharacterized protein YndB with AHSA1/START domain